MISPGLSDFSVPLHGKSRATVRPRYNYNMHVTVPHQIISIVLRWMHIRSCSRYVLTFVSCRRDNESIQFATAVNGRCVGLYYDFMIGALEVSDSKLHVTDICYFAFATSACITQMVSTITCHSAFHSAPLVQQSHVGYLHAANMRD